MPRAGRGKGGLQRRRITYTQTRRWTSSFREKRRRHKKRYRAHSRQLTRRPAEARRSAGGSRSYRALKIIVRSPLVAGRDVSCSQPPLKVRFSPARRLEGTKPARAGLLGDPASRGVRRRDPRTGDRRSGWRTAARDTRTPAARFLGLVHAKNLTFSNNDRLLRTGARASYTPDAARESSRLPPRSAALGRARRRSAGLGRARAGSCPTARAAAYDRVGGRGARVSASQFFRAEGWRSFARDLLGKPIVAISPFLIEPPESARSSPAAAAAAGSDLADESRGSNSKMEAHLRGLLGESCTKREMPSVCATRPLDSAAREEETGAAFAIRARLATFDLRAHVGRPTFEHTSHRFARRIRARRSFRPRYRGRNRLAPFTTGASSLVRKRESLSISSATVLHRVRKLSLLPRANVQANWYVFGENLSSLDYTIRAFRPS